jgi:alpha-glucoside transport system permease protein
MSTPADPGQPDSDPSAPQRPPTAAVGPVGGVATVEDDPVRGAAHTPVRKQTAAATARDAVSKPWASLAAIVMALLWTLPTFGLFVTSFRPVRQINRSGWWEFFTDPGQATLRNYESALAPGDVGLAVYFVNSAVITIPAVLLPILLASLAAYAFAWMDFPLRNTLFVAVFALQIVPLQVALVPLLRIYNNNLGIGGTYWAVWISHTIFALPLAVFILHNFMRELPRELIEAARVDGAGHVRIFFRVLLPLLTPALAAFGIFQFLWVWNDLLVSLVFLGGDPAVAPLTVRLAELSGSRGSAWHVLSAGAFISMIVPVLVFISLQRYFVRGLLAGGLKG